MQPNRQLIESHTSSRKPGTKDGLDFLPTPPWATRALLERLPSWVFDKSVWEPACGRLDMVRPLRERFSRVYYSDIHRHVADDPCYEVENFLVTKAYTNCGMIITNPPFKLLVPFIARAVQHARYGAAMLVRTNALEGITRFKLIFQNHPPTRMMQFAERVPMFAGRLGPDRSTKTSYMWMVWMKGTHREPLEWIEPCRNRLEREGDYDQYLSPKLV